MFKNREDAGRQLAEQLRGWRLRAPLVLGIPRGGVVIGAVLAHELGAELDVVLARKLRAPYQPELAIGAVSEQGEVFLMPHAEQAGAREEYLQREREHQLAEIARRKELFRRVRPAARSAGRSVIVTDDGVATGATLLAALHVFRHQHPHELIVAVPVGAPERLREIGRHCDRLVCLLAPEDFWAIGQFYEDFEQIDDAVVLDLLRRQPALAKS
jgi:predicted phosphoribosyltransferase